MPVSGVCRTLFIALQCLVCFKLQAQSPMLLLDMRIQIEATDAVNQMYNFKFEPAESKFKELIQRHPDHPLPYYLMGLSHWWRMLPYDSEHHDIKSTEANFLSYMDAAIDKAKAMYDKRVENPEANFFLSAAHGLKARHYAENGGKLKSIAESKSAFKYLKRVTDSSDLSPEFLFGKALFTYYGEWFKDEYPLLRPVLAFFPKGSRKEGIELLQEVAQNAFYTKTEAQYFLVKICSFEEKADSVGFPMCRYLVQTYPDNPVFERLYMQILRKKNYTKALIPFCENLAYKISIGMPGYEDQTGRLAYYYLGDYYQGLDKTKSKLYYQKAIEAAKRCGKEYFSYTLECQYGLARYDFEDKNFASCSERCRLIIKKLQDKKWNWLREDAKVLLKNSEKNLKKTKRGESVRTG